MYQHGHRATAVMSDQVVLWSDKVQTAIEKLFSSLFVVLISHALILKSGDNIEILSNPTYDTVH